MPRIVADPGAFLFTFFAFSKATGIMVLRPDARK